MDDLLTRHRRESKDLQARVTSKKKNATKKTRKGVNDECARLESDLQSRHAAEVAALSTSSDPSTSTTTTTDGPSSPLSSSSVDLASTIASLSVSSPPPAGSNPDASDAAAGARRPSRAKARLARRAAEQEALVEAAAAEAAAQPDLRARARERMAAALAAHGLVEHPVRSDGHCLYAALADQLAAAGIEVGAARGEGGEGEKRGEGGEGKARGEGGEGRARGEAEFRDVRREVARYVLAHRDEFAPFLDEEELADGGVEGYARRVADTAEWGGQVEILAGARRWGLVVRVIQGDGRVERIEGVEGGSECWLAYYKHSFGLGEHYNSLRKKA